jgi:hypothetical protein
LVHKVTRGAISAAVLATSIAAVALAPAAGAASAGSTVGGCQLAGSAAFSPGLGATSKPFSYSFGGSLSGCQSSDPTAPTSGYVAAGEQVQEKVVNASTGATDTVTYQEPLASGTGGCASSDTKGEALVRWADGTTSVISYATSGAAAAVALTGSIIPSMTLTAVNAQAGDPSTYTISTTRYAGASSTGTLAFQPPDPTACNTSTGVTTAGISGFVGLSG